MSTDRLYFLCFLLALAVSAAATPLMRALAIKIGILDHPISDVKTHKQPTPYLGGVAVARACRGGARDDSHSTPSSRGTIPESRVRQDAADADACPPAGPGAPATGSADGSWIATSPFGLLAMTAGENPARASRPPGKSGARS